MGELRVRPWNRYGKSRLYVSDEAGNRVGWYDLQTGVSTIERTDLADDFAVALQPYVDGAPESLSSPAGSARTVTEDVTSHNDQAPASGPRVDLAGRRAGQGARAEADTAWEACKDESRLRAYTGRLLDAKTDERAWRRGAEGEEAVGAALEKLRSRGWLALHSVPVGKRGSDIDHVVIGPGGVFTINTKNHLGHRVSVSARGVWVGGHWQPYLRNSEHEATRASRLLSEACGLPVVVRGVVVIFADDFKRKSAPEAVSVLASSEMRRWLKKRPRVLDADQFASIYEQARYCELWTR